MLGVTGILMGTFFLNLLYLQEVQHASALGAGLEFIPLALMMGRAPTLARGCCPGPDHGC
jgi:hypothetical protein